MSEVHHPHHYNACGDLDEDGSAKYEAIKVIEDWGLGFCLGNAVKYICRAPHKGTEKKDLEKARWYIDRVCEHPEYMKIRDARRLTAADACDAWGLPSQLRLVVGQLYAGETSIACRVLGEYLVGLS